jgi:hypothetical protein
MTKISTISLDADAHHAGVQHGTISRGELDAAKITELLGNFQSIDGMEMLDLDPQVIAAGRECTLIIRTSRKKLFVYNAKNMNEAAVEMTPAEILQRLDNVKPAMAVEEVAEAGMAAAPPPSRSGMGWFLLAVALLINGYTGYSIFSRGKDINDKSDIIIATDASQIAQQQRTVAGTYATGSTAGNRMLIIGADGTLQYSEIGAPGNPPPWNGTYHIGSRNNNLCLSVDGDSVVDVIDNDTLLYYRDTFHRIK